MINIEKFICSVMKQQSEYHNAPINRSHIQEALREQGYEYNNGTIVKISTNWKPSEEQITAVRRMKAAVGPGPIYEGLESLYNDLQKLMEE